MQIHADLKGKVDPDDITLWANRCKISRVKHILLGGGYCHACVLSSVVITTLLCTVFCFNVEIMVVSISLH